MVSASLCQSDQSQSVVRGDGVTVSGQQGEQAVFKIACSGLVASRADSSSMYFVLV